MNGKKKGKKERCSVAEQEEPCEEKQRCPAKSIHRDAVTVRPVFVDTSEGGGVVA